MMGCSYKESAAINLIIALGTVLALDFSMAHLSLWPWCHGCIEIGVSLETLLSFLREFPALTFSSRLCSLP